MRYALALILLFIAPSAWGEPFNGQIWTTGAPQCLIDCATKAPFTSQSNQETICWGPCGPPPCNLSLTAKDTVEIGRPVAPGDVCDLGRGYGIKRITRGAQSAEIPDSIKTPGVIAEDGHDIRNVCGVVKGLSYSKRHRATPEGLKAMIRKRDHAIGQGEVDHRLPLALGGADVVYDLWWQPGPDSGATWTFVDKDRLETEMWHRVCREGSYGLAQAQAVFLAPDWRVSYCAEFKDERCAK